MFPFGDQHSPPPTPDARPVHLNVILRERGPCCGPACVRTYGQYVQSCLVRTCTVQRIILHSSAVPVYSCPRNIYCTVRYDTTYTLWGKTAQQTMYTDDPSLLTLWVRGLMLVPRCLIIKPRRSTLLRAAQSVLSAPYPHSPE